MLRKDDELCNAGSEKIVKNPSDLYEVRKSFLKLFLDFKTRIGYFDSNVRGAGIENVLRREGKYCVFD